MSEARTAWWAVTPSRSRRSSIAGLVILLALTGVSTVVWTSPREATPGQVLGAVFDVADPTDELEAEYDALLAEHADLQVRFETQSGSVGDLQQQLTELEASLEVANAALAQARSENDSLTAQLTGPAGPSVADGGAAGVPDGSTAPSPGSGAPEPSPAPSEPGAPTDPEVTAPPRADLVAPDSTYFGMYTQQAPFNWATFDDTSSRLGVRPDVVGYFGGWDQDFRPDAVERAWERGALPVLTWESRPIGAANDVVDEPEYALPLIIDGAFDDYLRQYARDVVEAGLPLGIRLNHEMNGTWYPWSETTSSGAPINGNRPGDYVRMWQHVHDIFEAEGANEYVFWIWAPNIVNNLPTAHRTPEHLASLYPGDDYVDWVGLSGYLRPPYRSDQTFTFSYTFDRSLAQLRDLTDKPIFLAEVGASETGGHKPQWVTSFFDGLAQEQNDDIVGFAWFNLAVTTYVQGERSTNDWRIDSRADSLAAFRDGLLDPANGFALLPY